MSTEFTVSDIATWSGVPRDLTQTRIQMMLSQGLVVAVDFNDNNEAVYMLSTPLPRDPEAALQRLMGDQRYEDIHQHRR